ncbi:MULTISPECIES: hypothetical protein [unclassified Janibacter]
MYRILSMRAHRERQPERRVQRPAAQRERIARVQAHQLVHHLPR